jgi:hypothetical protein
MKKWPHLSELFAFHPFSEQENAPAGTLTQTHRYAHWQKIKFDNTVRAWIAGPTFIACYFLWAQSVIASMTPILALFGVYALLQFSLNWYFMGSRHGRVFDFILGGMDIVGMSAAIYWTGAGDSPLYFLYFIPLIIHAFHRDSTVVMFSGFGGVGLYAVTIALSFSHVNAVLITNLVARLFFMLLTVGVACLAIAVLKRKDEYHRRQVARLESQTRLSEMLNLVVMVSDIDGVKNALAPLISDGLDQPVRLEMRFGSGMPRGLEISAPENSREHSGVSIPVYGSENELFGELSVHCSTSHAFQKEEMLFLRFVARSLGLAIQRVLRMDELRKSLEMNSCVMAANIASVRSLDATYRAVTEGIMTVLRVGSAELLIWSEELKSYRLVHRMGTLDCAERQVTFLLKTLHGENLGEIKVERSASSLDFQAGDLEVAATFAVRAALAIENAFAHRRERNSDVRQVA